MARQKLNQGTFPTGAGGDNWRTGSAKLDEGIGELYSQFGANNQGVLPSALPINKGGTGATTAANARTNLDVFSKSEVTKAIEAINIPEVPGASTSRKGIVQLANALNDASVVKALTAAMGKKLQEEKLDISEVGTSGNKIPRLSASNDWSGTQNYSYRIRLARPNGLPYISLSNTTATATGNAAFGRILFGYGGAGADWGIEKQVSFIESGRLTEGVDFLSINCVGQFLTLRSDGLSNYSGNASSASKLETARKINSVEFNGSKDINIQPISELIPRDSELNNYKNIGFFRCPTNAIALTVKNTPMSGVFCLTVTATAGVKQEFTSFEPRAPRVFVRTYYDFTDTWGEWFEVAYTTGNVASATKLQTARKINGVDFDGSTDVNISVPLPTASTTVKGGIKVGTGLSISAEALSVQFASQTEANAGADDTKAITSKKMNEAVKNQLNATGSAPTFACRAWVNFNGVGTPVIHGSGNVASVVRTSSGTYTITFIKAMPLLDYAVSSFGSFGSSQPNARILWENLNIAKTANSISISVSNIGGDLIDGKSLSISIFC